MAEPFQSALLNLKLFEMRREPVLRDARQWFLRDFNPESLEELIAAVGGERNDSFRMVIGYWDMAASMVTTGAIDAESFLLAHGEIYATFSKIQPFLGDLRSLSGEKNFGRQMEAVLQTDPDADATLQRRREAALAAARARRTTSE